jgi:hypothetical protein
MFFTFFQPVLLYIVLLQFTPCPFFFHTTQIETQLAFEDITAEGALASIHTIRQIADPESISTSAPSW